MSNRSSIRALIALAVGCWLMGGQPAALGAQPACALAPDFAALRDELPEVVGECPEDERLNPASGNIEQRTVGGMLLRRPADGLVGFSDGATLWLAGPDGLTSRLVDGPPFPWESASTPGADSAAGTIGPIDVRKLLLVAHEVQGGTFVRDEQGSSYEERPDGSARAVITFLSPGGRVGDPPQFFSVVERHPDQASAEAALRALQGNSFQMRALQLVKEPEKWDEIRAPQVGEAGRAFRSKRAVVLYRAPDGNPTFAAMAGGWLWARRGHLVYGIGMLGLEELVSVDALWPRLQVVDGRVQQALADPASFALEGRP